METILYKVFSVGGQPDDEWKLSMDLRDTVEEIQKNGYTIGRIDKNLINRAYSTVNQSYVTTQEYVIIAYKKARVMVKEPK